MYTSLIYLVQSAVLLCVCLNVLLTIAELRALGPRLTLHFLWVKSISHSASPAWNTNYLRSSPLVSLSLLFLLNWTWWHYLSLPSGILCASVLHLCLTEISPETKTDRWTETKCVTHQFISTQEVTDCLHFQYIKGRASLIVERKKKCICLQMKIILDIKKSAST